MTNIQCPRCKSTDLRKNGTHREQQAWFCRGCERYFVEGSSIQWSSAEIAMLKRMYETGERIEDIVVALDKTASAIKSELSRLKITRKQRPPMKEEHRQMRSEILKGRHPYEMTDEIRQHMRTAQRKRERGMTQVERDKRLQHMRQIQPKGIQEAAKLRRRQGIWNKGLAWVKMSNSQRRRVRKRLALGNGLTAALFEEKWEKQQGHCFYCDRKMKRKGNCFAPSYATQDHKIALFKGGQHTPDNIVPACRECNDRKSIVGIEEFQTRSGRLPLILKEA